MASTRNWQPEGGRPAHRSPRKPPRRNWPSSMSRCRRMPSVRSSLTPPFPRRANSHANSRCVAWLHIVAGKRRWRPGRLAQQDARAQADRATAASTWRTANDFAQTLARRPRRLADSSATRIGRHDVADRASVSRRGARLTGRSRAAASPIAAARGGTRSPRPRAALTKKLYAKMRRTRLKS